MKPFQSFAVVLAVFMVSVPGFAAATKPETIQTEADQRCQALVHKDFAKVADYTLPKTVELLGGRSLAIEALRLDFQQMESQGIFLDSIEVGAPTHIMTVEGTKFAVVPQKTVLRYPMGKAIQEGFLIAVSENGTRWYFVDSNNLDEKTEKSLLPKLVGKLDIPKAKPPVFVRTEKPAG